MPIVVFLFHFSFGVLRSVAAVAAFDELFFSLRFILDEKKNHFR